ncbi:MAG: hypothetical protein JRN37_09920 [Nitrososphaerota archaeon]|jgi:hypothetical protein|nr:hypothetical protein [Nitrososphaerota archaeon]MDG7039446.1 hypothetical protein [Nitrososphaerota archaeon]
MEHNIPGDNNEQKHKKGYYDETIPLGDPRELQTYTIYRVSLRTIRKVKALKQKLGFKTV